MIRVSIDNLKEGMVIAEPILDLSGKVLLSAKSQLTQKHINVLKIWDIDFVRIWEEHDTDENLAREIKKDKEKEQQELQQQKVILNQKIKQELGLNEETVTSILSGAFEAETIYKKEQIKMGTLVTQQSLKTYSDFANYANKLFQANTRFKDMAIAEINDLAQKITAYICNTPGVIGYMLKPINGEYNEFARHVIGTTIVAGKIAMILNLSLKDVSNIVLGSLLHDIGKLKLPEEVLQKTKKISEQEKILYQNHVSLGISMVKGKNWIPKEVLLIIAQHHERIDGKGFPLGFTGNKIHLYAKIVAIADYFDHITHSQTKDADTLGLIEIINKLPTWSNRFDILICEVFREYLRNFLLSNNVKLDDGRMAEIIYMHQTFAEPVIRTNDGQIIDLNKNSNYRITRYSI